MCCSVKGSICLVCVTVFVNYLAKEFAICLGVVVILLLNVMEVFSVGRGALLDRPCIDSSVWSSKECACCASKCSFHRFFFMVLNVGSNLLI